MGEYVITYETLGEFSHHKTVQTALAELKDKGYKQDERSTARYYDNEGRLATIDFNEETLEGQYNGI